MKRLVWSSLCLCVFLSSCTDSNKHHVDLSNHQVDLKVDRLEKDLFAVGRKEDLEELKKENSDFIEYYLYDDRLLGEITGGNRVSDGELVDNYLKFINHDDIQDLYKEVETKFDNMENFEDAFSNAFSYYAYHLPNHTIPEIFTFISPFYTATVPLDSSMGIGLDMFLGSDFEPYSALGSNFPQYRIKKMRPDYLVPIALTSWLKSELPHKFSRGRLIDEMVYEGKILYALDALLPDTEDSLKIGHFQGQLEWCELHEKNIWANFVKEDLLYSTKKKLWEGCLHDGPFSKGLNVPQESSPRIASYTGWQMVRAYMDKFPETKLYDLFEEIDAETVLSKSGYKPR